ncbi:DUF6279 family lipoprotein [Alteromonas flava]|uniref:DUF6279 family lipoprotein n=1 Tax=Alteromonas flava TaxID=2048003 RepID=UPI000C282173|nr:DUF6279 family lipoprotein [Alteromonas flava]
MRHWLLIGITLIFISGCSSKFAYNNLDWLVYWYVDDYIELTDQQESIFDEKLHDWLKWHRQQELAVYVEHLQLVKQTALGSELTPEQITAQIDIAQQHWERLRDRLVPELANMATTLSDEQVVYLFAALEKENQKREEKRAELTDEERLEQRQDDLVEDVEEMIGRLTDEQEQIVMLYAPSYQSSYEDWIAYRRTVQQAARSLFAGRKENPNFVQDLQALMLAPEQFRSERQLEVQEHNRRLYSTMIAEIHSTLTDKQKRKLAKEISAIIADLEDLMS